jgi:hypothetical protein
MERFFYPIISNKRLLIFLLGSMLMFGATLNAQYTVFSTDPAAADDNYNDGVQPGPTTGITTAFKFQVTQIGTVSAIRFYAGEDGGGSNTVTLWTNAGVSLGSATSTVSAGPGWKQINITGVFLVPGTTYVVSRFNPLGYYAETVGGIGLNNDPQPPFIVVGALDDPIGNGVYAYTDNAALFPNNPSMNASNYWVDLVFTPTFSLPVTLVDFDAAVSNKNVGLSWKTRTEQNNRGFDIQRSNNGTDWYTIGFVAGAGESTTTKSYSYTDKSLAPGLYYYRLNQLDHDGKSKTSSTVTATIGGKGAITLNFANPFVQSGSIRFDLPTAQKIRLSVVDLSGREVKVLADKKAEAGSHLIKLDRSALGRQTYFIRLQTETEVITKKILVD